MSKNQIVGLTAVLGLRILWFLFEAPWYDEYFTLAVATLPLGTLVEAVQGDVHPPAFYLLAWAVAQAMPTLPAIRLVSVLAVAVLVWLSLRHAGQQYGQGVQTKFAVLLVASVAILLYGTEARSYALLALVVFCGYLVAIDQGNPLPLGIIIATGFYTHNAMILYAPILFFIYWQGADFPQAGIKRAGQAAIFAALIYAPWLPYALAQAQGVGSGYWVSAPRLGEMIQFVHYATLGPDSVFVFITVPVVIALLAYTPQINSSVYFMAFGPAALGLVLSYVFTPILMARVLVPSTVFILLIMATTWHQLAQRHGHILPVLLLSPIFAHAVLYTPRPALNPPPVQYGETCYHLNPQSVIVLRSIIPQCEHRLIETVEYDPRISFSEQTQNALGIETAPAPHRLRSGRWLIATRNPFTTQAETNAEKAILSASNAQKFTVSDQTFNETHAYTESD